MFISTDSFIGKKLLVLTAHPDDEAFCAGGTIYLNGRNGGKTFLACATHGEHGRASLGQNLSLEEVKNIRSDELSRASKELGITEVLVSDLPDRELAKHKKELFAVWRTLVESVKPDAILGFGEDGYTGHLDHIIAGSVAHKLAGEFKIPYYAFSLPGGERRHSFESYFKKKRTHGVYAEKCLHKPPDTTLEVDSEMKYRILHIYKSQFPGLDPYHIFSKKDAEHFLRYEYFVKS